MRRPPTRRLSLAAAMAVALGLGAAAANGQSADPRIAEAEALVESGNGAAALELIEKVVARRPADARARLVASSARFVLGEVERGRRELERALELDPGLRQGWLNLGALELSEGDYDAAAAALERARDLDPQAPDNELNLGAVRLLQGRVEDAAALFQRYFDDNPGSGAAVYLVASNYAMAGFRQAAVDLLERAIDLDERVRFQARTDPNFADFERDPDYALLMSTDRYRPPPGAHESRLGYEAAYRGGEGRLLSSVLDALEQSGQRVDPRIEVTPDWALAWAEALRVRIATAPDGRGEVLLTAPARAFAAAEWTRMVEDLDRRITVQLVRRSGTGVRRP